MVYTNDSTNCLVISMKGEFVASYRFDFFMLFFSLLRMLDYSIISLQDKESRLSILRVKTRQIPLAVDVDLEAIADATERYSGAGCF